MNSKHLKTIFAWVALGALLGSLTTYFTISWNRSRATTTPPLVSIMVIDGTSIRSWPSVDLSEGNSVADLLQKVSDLDHFPVLWNSEGRDRVLTSVNGGMTGSWQYYVNQAPSNAPLAKFYPKRDDKITIVRTQ